jgi:hypothetical protein
MYMYTVRFIQSGSFIVRERSGKGNVSNSSLVSIDTATISDGNYTVNILAEDLNGNLTTSNTLSVVVDNTAPSVFSMISPLFTTDSTPLLSWNSSSDVHGAITYDVIVDSVTLSSNQSGTTYQIGSVYTEGVNHTVSIVAEDTFGNTRTTSSNIGLDVTVPTLGSPNVVVNGNGVTITYTNTDNFSGVGVHQISLNGGGFQSHTYPYVNSSLTDSPYTFTTRVYDNALNFSEISGSFIIDARKIFLTTKADFNTDSNVDLTDLSILASNWGSSNNVADTNSDGVTDLTDLSVLASNWNQNF